MNDENNMVDSLSYKQNAFVRKYLLSGNATKSAVEAGYSEKTAYSQGQRLLKKVEIQKYLENIRENEQEVVNISRITLLNDLVDLKNKSFEKEEYKTTLKAISEINKMMGWYYSSNKENIIPNIHWEEVKVCLPEE